MCLKEVVLLQLSLVCTRCTDHRGMRRASHLLSNLLRLPQTEEQRHQQVSLLAAFPLWDHVDLSNVIYPQVGRWLPVECSDERQNLFAIDQKCLTPFIIAFLEMRSNAPIPSTLTVRTWRMCATVSQPAFVLSAYWWGEVASSTLVSDLLGNCPSDNPPHVTHHDTADTQVWLLECYQPSAPELLLGRKLPEVTHQRSEMVRGHAGWSWCGSLPRCSNVLREQLLIQMK